MQPDIDITVRNPVQVTTKVERPLLELGGMAIDVAARQLQPGTWGDRVDGPVTGSPKSTRMTRTTHSQCIAPHVRSIPFISLISDL